jgi:pimeloyl-ACP methyl ester carboxylesterase
MIEVAGTTLACREAGAGATVLFLHDAAGASWDPLLDALSVRYRVLAPEHPGFGRGKIPDWMLSVGDVAFCYLDLLHALDLRHVHLVGHGRLDRDRDRDPQQRAARLTGVAGAGRR